jgi:hypothetical protein
LSDLKWDIGGNLGVTGKTYIFFTANIECDQLKIDCRIYINGIGLIIIPLSYQSIKLKNGNKTVEPLLV